MELCSMLCASLDGSKVWGRMITYICMAESLPRSPEIITTLLIGYIPIQNKKLKVKKKKKQRHHFDDKHPYSQSYDFSSSHVWI